MIPAFVRRRLELVCRRHQSLRLRHVLAVCWMGAALIGLGFLGLRSLTGWASSATWVVLALLAVVAAVARGGRLRRSAPDARWAALQIERGEPELNGLLLTAVQQTPSPNGEWSYLQRQLLSETCERAYRGHWSEVIPRSRLVWANVVHLAALGFFAFVLWKLHLAPPTLAGMKFARAGAGVTVAPGDTQLERGENLVVLARFGGALPAEVHLVVDPLDRPPQRIPLVKNLADPVFGGSVLEVQNDLRYHLEYAGQRTRVFKVTVFEHPKLVRADADLSFPSYTGQSPKHVEDTRRLSAVEGSRLDLTLQLNKPVSSARLVARDKDKRVVLLAVVTNQPAVTLKQFSLEISKTYDLQLLDADGRTNKTPTAFAFEVLKNRLPELRVTSPSADLRPSPLEEVRWEGTCWDDFGLTAYGLAYSLGGQETQYIELGRDVPAREKRAFQHLFHLEDMGAQTDQLISWFAWAEDLGPDGKVRRTSGDLFFAEVRPFDETFREGQGRANQEASNQSESEQAAGEGNQAARLLELQKQIIQATWKLQRDHSQTAPAQYTKDTIVVRDSQAHALEQAESQQEEAANPARQGSWEAVLTAMGEARDQLARATNSPAPLVKALAAEQQAYQALLKVQAREFEVARARNRSRGQRGGQQAGQRQLDQLDLTQPDSRYETQRQARAPQTPERREQLQVLNRLQELARRQQDLNDRLKELQTALQEARTEPEREEIRRRLKRLAEEEQQMLGDVDELRQRMERPENQSRMANERRQLDQTREEVQRAARAAEQASVSQALASGTRAQRQLQELRDELRQATSSQFASEMRQMRTEARELSQRQEGIQQSLDQLNDTQRKTLSDARERKDLLNQLAQQKERLTNLVDHATQVSQQAETSEPLLSRQLYETLRKFSQDDGLTGKDLQEELLRRGLLTQNLYDRLKAAGEREGAKTLELTAEMLRRGYLPLADQVEDRARAGIGELQRGVERAAESVLGDETEALRLAREELDQITDQLNQERERAERGDATRAGDAGSRSREQTSSSNRPPTRQAGDGQRAASSGGAGSTNEVSSPESAQANRATGGGERRAEGRAQAPGGARSPGDRDASANAGPRDASRANRAEAARAGNSLRGGTGPQGPDWEGGLVDLRRGTVGPITGEDFAAWSDRLREVEELLDWPDWRTDVARARERARQFRLEYRRDLRKPDWAVLELQVVKPLVEVRHRIAEELARRESHNALAPIDRDPVPGRYAELVRRYYEDLGKDKGLKK